MLFLHRFIRIHLAIGSGIGSKPVFLISVALGYAPSNDTSCHVNKVTHELPVGAPILSPELRPRAFLIYPLQKGGLGVV